MKLVAVLADLLAEFVAHLVASTPFRRGWVVEELAAALDPFGVVAQLRISDALNTFCQ